MRVEPCAQTSIADWVALRAELWPDEDAAVMAAEAPAILADPDKLVLLAREAGEAVGFAEAAVRQDYVNGCETSPVAFLEGIYVREARRRHGVARALVAACEDWARSKGLREFASDALLDNTRSHAMHAALGFEETERVVYFRKDLTVR